MAFNLKAGNSGNPMHKNFASSFPTKDVKLKGKHDEKVRRSKQPKGTTYDEADDSSNAPASPMDKRTKKVGSRTDYTEREDKEVNTLTKTNEKTGESKTKDISQRRADRIENRQEKKQGRKDKRAVAPQARKDVRAAKKGGETSEEIDARIRRDFPADFGAADYSGPSLAELQARHKITDRIDKDVKPMEGKELADYKTKLEAELRAETAAEKAGQ